MKSQNSNVSFIWIPQFTIFSKQLPNLSIATPIVIISNNLILIFFVLEDLEKTEELIAIWIYPVNQEQILWCLLKGMHLVSQWQFCFHWPLSCSSVKPPEPCFCILLGQWCQ